MEKYIDVESLKTLAELWPEVLLICFAVFYVWRLERRFDRWCDDWQERRETERERREAAYKELETICERTKHLCQTSAAEWKKLNNRILSVESCVAAIETNFAAARNLNKNVYDNIRNEIDALGDKIAEFEEQTKKERAFKRPAEDFDAVFAKLDDLFSRVDALESRNRLQDAAVDAWKTPKNGEYDG